MKNIFKNILEKELAYFARLTYLKFRPYVFGITGSSGKTTVRYMIAQLMRETVGNTFEAQENMNTETGLPMSVLGFKRPPIKLIIWIYIFFAVPIKYLFTFKYPKYIVLEYAADKPGDISYLCDIIPPDVAIITNIGVAHIEAFESVEKIASEKWHLAQAAKQRIICDEQTYILVKNIDIPRAEILISGQAKTAKATNIKYQSHETRFDLVLFGKGHPTSFSFWGAHNIANIEKSVLAVSTISGDIPKIVRTIRDLKPGIGRGRRMIGKKNVLLIDESYNANPLSMAAALDNLNQAGDGHKVAIIGEMKEIGPISQKAHLEVAKKAKDAADLVVGVGDGFKDLGLDKWYQNVEELTGEIDSLIKEDDIVLVKGSHAVHLEKIIERFG